MSSPAPLLRPPIPGSRHKNDSRTPRLGLAIPSSTGVKPQNNGHKSQGLSLQLPGLSLKPSQQTTQPTQPTTSKIKNPTAQELSFLQNHRHITAITSIQSSNPNNEIRAPSSSAQRNHSDILGMPEGRVSGPTSAGSQYSALSFAQYGLRQSQGTPDHSPSGITRYSEHGENGVGMERDCSLNGLESFGKLSLERARTLDVEDLDDDGWRIASMENRIEELSSLGEGAGGAVTKCVLKGGKTVFALKV